MRTDNSIIKQSQTIIRMKKCYVFSMCYMPKLRMWRYRIVKINGKKKAYYLGGSLRYYSNYGVKSRYRE